MTFNFEPFLATEMLICLFSFLLKVFSINSFSFISSLKIIFTGTLLFS